MLFVYHHVLVIGNIQHGVALHRSEVVTRSRKNDIQCMNFPG